MAYYLNKLSSKIILILIYCPDLENPNLLDMEKNFYKKVLKNNFKFILNPKKSSYEIVENYKFIFSTYSTLAIECLAKGSRVGFIMIKSKTNPVYNFRFGSFENFKKKGMFWTTLNKVNIQEIIRVFNFVVKTKKQTWNLKTKLLKKKIMNFDYDNKQFKSIIKNF